MLPLRGILLPLVWLLTALPAVAHTDVGDSCARQSEPSEDPYAQMCYLVRRNGMQQDIHWLPPHAIFHNHVTYELVAMYKLGANASMLSKAYEKHAPLVAPAFESTHYINESNWLDNIGAHDRGETNTTSVHYADYLEFFHGKIQELGTNATVEWALPHLANGLAGDLFHAVIQMGYAFEAMDDEVVAQGLAWMAVGYQHFPPFAASPVYTNIRQAMDDLYLDRRLPANVSVKELQEQYAVIMTEYDLSIDDAPAAELVQQVMEDISLAVLDFFGTDGYRSFFILHLCTGSRAVQMILAQLGAAPATQALLLRRLWIVVLYYFVEFGRPLLEIPDVNATSPSWEELGANAIPFLDEHLVKMVYLARENEKLWNVPRYRLMADKVVSRFQSGKGWEFGSRIGPDYSNRRSGTIMMMLLFFAGVAAVVLLPFGAVACQRCIAAQRMRQEREISGQLRAPLETSRGL